MKFEEKTKERSLENKLAKQQGCFWGWEAVRSKRGITQGEQARAEIQIAEKKREVPRQKRGTTPSLTSNPSVYDVCAVETRWSPDRNKRGDCGYGTERKGSTLMLRLRRREWRGSGMGMHVNSNCRQVQARCWY